MVGVSGAWLGLSVAGALHSASIGQFQYGEIADYKWKEFSSLEFQVGLGATGLTSGIHVFPAAFDDLTEIPLRGEHGGNSPGDFHFLSCCRSRY